MDIPNLANQLPTKSSDQITFSVPALLIVLTLSVVSGFWLSRLTPPTKSNSNPTANSTSQTSTDSISGAADLVVGKVYGHSDQAYKDTATGVVEKGSINGEGTHILNREGGADQRASLTSSTVDLDLFVGKKVEVKGSTQASTKTGWLLDVGNIKIIQ